MAGSILFPNKPHWTVGSHTFDAIVDRIRGAVPESEKKPIEPLFEPVDQAFDFICLDADVSPEAFQCFAQVARSEYERFSKTPDSAVFQSHYYPGIKDCWAELLRLLAADNRWIAPQE